MNNSSPHLFTIAQLSDLIYRNASSLREPKFAATPERTGSALQASNFNNADSSYESGALLELCATAAASNSLQFSFQI